MKKVLCVLTALACVMTCAFSFAACGENQTHTHEWSATYTQDGNRHYRTCGGCSEKNYANHDYGTNGVCVCGKEKPAETHNHTWSETYTEDGDRHYRTCNGCTEKSYDNHDYGTSGVCVCGKQKPVTVIAVESVTLNQAEITLEIDETENLTASVLPDNATDKTVTYSVEPAGIVTVDNTGKVTAITNGTAVITATASGKTSQCSVTVNAPITNADIVNALDKNYKVPMLEEALFGFDFTIDMISNGKWILATTRNDKISSAEYTFTLARTALSYYYIVAKIEFNFPISIKDLIIGNFENIKYSNAYQFGYNPTIQAQNKEITNAICETLFGTQGNNYLARYIVDGGDGVGDSKLGYHHKYTVVEATENGINQIGISIKKNNVNDNEYISKLLDENKYTTYSEKSYTLLGKLLENNNEPFIG